MRNTLGILFSVCVALLAAPAFAQGKLGFVDSQRVLRDSPLGIKASKRIEDEFKRREQEIQQLGRRVQSMQESLEKNAMTMAESERRNREREFNELNRELQRKQREFSEDLNLRRNEEMAAIFERANKVIRQIAESEKFDLIVQEAVYYSPRIDITDKVIKALGDSAK